MLISVYLVYISCLKYSLSEVYRFIALSGFIFIFLRDIVINILERGAF